MNIYNRIIIKNVCIVFNRLTRPPYHDGCPQKAKAHYHRLLSAGGSPGQAAQ
jgi:hypothetical protein